MNYKISSGTHSFELAYIEDEKRMQLLIDLREPVIFLNEDIVTTWEPPFDKLKITKKDKSRILKNIYKYFRKRSDFKVTLED